MKLDAEAEMRLKRRAVAVLEKGRPGWDVPHTLAVVHWIKELIMEEGGDELALIAAAYLHDVGYSKAFKENTHDSVMSVKDDHMAHGVSIAKGILEDFDFPKAEKEEILHLIAVHDDLENLKSNNEILLQEADALGQIDMDRAKPTFSDEEKRKFIRSFEKRRVPRFRTRTGLRYLDLMLPRIKKKYGLE